MVWEGRAQRTTTTTTTTTIFIKKQQHSMTTQLERGRDECIGFKTAKSLMNKNEFVIEARIS